ncbi:hypothetical protein EXT73_24455 [Pectobacterium atrosepticum]|nr:hypothetical protein [Pectobacterium atrosepticum]
MNNKKIRSMPDLIYPPLIIIFLQIIIHYIIFATFTYQETEQNEYMCKFTLPIDHTAISQHIYRRGERRGAYIVV